MTTALNAVYEDITGQFETHLESIKRLIRQQSISADGTGIEEMAAMIRDILEALGAEAKIVETPGFPIVHGTIDVGSDRTLLVYGMYDTMPVEGETWIVPPFDAEVVDVQGVGASIVARGVENSKGPLGAWFAMLDSWKRVNGSYPVNITFVIEGEEELASPSLAAFVDENRDVLQADGGIYPCLTQSKEGTPVLHLGFKGILFYELTVRGGNWGGPSVRAVHSSRAIWYNNPAMVLSKALASLVNSDETTVAIEGFYDDVAALSDSDSRLLDHLGESFDPKSSLEQDDVSRFKSDVSDLRLLENYLFQPSLSIDGIFAGDMGPGEKTILPHEAKARIEFRYVPDQSADDLTLRLREHLDRNGFEQVEVELMSTTKWSRTASDSLAALAAVRSYEDLGFEAQVWPTMAGSSPMYLFTEVLDIPVVSAGLGHGGGAHAPDEYASVAGLELCAKSLASFLDHFAQG